MVRAIEVSFAVVVNEVTFGSTPLRLGAGFKGTNQVIIWLKLCLTSHPSGSGGCLEVESVAYGQWFSLSCLSNETSTKTKRTGFGEFSLYRLGLERRWCTGEDLGALCPVPISCPMHLFHLDIKDNKPIDALKAQLLCTLVLNRILETEFGVN